MSETKKIIRQEVASLSSLANRQIGVLENVDADLGYRAWGGKDANGDVTIFLAKDKYALVSDLKISGIADGNSGILKYDGVGLVEGEADLTLLADVNITSPTNLQALIYNSTTSKWENTDIVTNGLNYKGVWNATTNSPALSDSGGGGEQGDFYIVAVAGTTEIDGEDDWEIRDWIVNNGTQWDKIDNTDQLFTYDDIYNHESGEHLITVDDGDVKWASSGANSFIIDTSGIPTNGVSDGFIVQDGTDQFSLLHASANNLRLDADLYDVLIDAAAASHINVTGADLTFQTTTSGDINLLAADVVMVGTGSPTYATASGDLYTEDVLETGGMYYSGGGITLLSNKGVTFGTDGMFQSDSAYGGSIRLRASTQTPDCMHILTGDISHVILISDYADRSTDFAPSGYNDPTVRIQSSDATSINECLELSYIAASDYAQIATGAGPLVLAPATYVSVGTGSPSHVAGSGDLFAVDDIEAGGLFYTEEGLLDQYLAAAVPISESGETALDTTAQSIVGGINEVYAMASGGGATKEEFWPTEASSTYGNYGDHKVWNLANSANWYHSFYIPHDFSSITELVVVIIPINTTSGYINIYSDYGAVGEDYQNHTQQALSESISTTTDQIYEIDISSIFSSAAAGDHCGIRINNVSGNSFYVKGVRLKYS